LFCLLLAFPVGASAGSKSTPKTTKFDQQEQRTRWYEAVHDTLVRSAEMIERNSTLETTVHYLREGFDKFVAGLQNDWRKDAKKVDGDHIAKWCPYTIVRGETQVAEKLNPVDPRAVDLMKRNWPATVQMPNAALVQVGAPEWLLRVPTSTSGSCAYYTAAMVAKTAPFALVVDLDVREQEDPHPIYFD
jgi:hypothetical protein